MSVSIETRRRWLFMHKPKLPGQLFASCPSGLVRDHKTASLRPRSPPGKKREKRRATCRACGMVAEYCIKGEA